MVNTAKRFNLDGSINIEELNKAYTRNYRKYDEVIEMRKIIEKIISEHNLG